MDSSSNPAGAASSASNQDNIEDLLRTLHGQIKTSEWAQQNEKKLINENPELIKAWKDAIDESVNPKANKESN